jgi:hypothetical protein
MSDVIRAVFEAAEGTYIPDQILARVVHGRFDEFLNPEGGDAAEFGASSDAVERLSGVAASGYFDVEVEDIAEYIWIDLSLNERLAYPVLLDAEGGDEARCNAVMAVLGCGPNEADATIASIFDRIRADELGDDRLAVLEALSRRAVGFSGRIRWDDEGEALL